MHQAWVSLMFADTEQTAQAEQDLVAPAQRKVCSRQTDDGESAHSFATLLAEMSTLVRNTRRVPGANEAPTFEVFTTANQLCALTLQQDIRP